MSVGLFVSALRGTVWALSVIFGGWGMAFLIAAALYNPLALREAMPLLGTAAFLLLCVRWSLK